MLSSLFGSYFVDVYLNNSIVSFEFQSKNEALNIIDLYVEKAQCISFYSYTYNPYNDEFKAIYPRKEVSFSKTPTAFPRLSRDIYRRQEDIYAFNSYRPPVRDYCYFPRK